MLKLGIPCVCIDLLGIALQVANSWAFIPDPIIPDIQCMTVNEWNNTGESKPAIANGRINSLFNSTNRWNGTIDDPIPTLTVLPIPSRNNWNNLVQDRDIRTIPARINFWEHPTPTIPDIKISLLNEWSTGNTIEAEIACDLENIWITDIASITLFESLLPRNNNWLGNGLLLNVNGILINNWVFDNVFPAQAELEDNVNLWENILDNKQIDISDLTNEWEVETFALIEVMQVNNWIPQAGNLIIPVSFITRINEWVTIASMPIPINQIRLNNWTNPNSSIIGIIKNTLTNSWTNSNSSFSPNIEVSATNQWIPVANLPDLVITAVGVFLNQWDSSIEIEGQEIEVCPVPCGFVISGSKITFVEIRLGEVKPPP